MIRGYIFLSCLFIQLALSSKICYAPDGSSIDDLRYQPCIAIDNVHSMCCRLNDTINPDTCDPTGLCVTDNPGYQGWWRDYCTDSTWESPNCVPKSTCDDAAGGSSSGTTQITPCAGGSDKYCCGDGNTTCCNDSDAMTLKATLVNIGGSATTTVTSTATAKNNSTTASGSSAKIAIGVGVGIPLAALSAAMLGVGFFWGRNNTRKKVSQTGYQESDGSMLLKEPQAELNTVPIHEISENYRPAYELPTHR